MALNVSVDTTIARIRDEADIPTTDQANSICTDAMLTAWLNDAYRSLYELISAEVGQERFAKKVVCTLASTFALPADFYRELGVEYQDGGQTLTARPFNFGERNASRFLYRPFYRISNGFILWEPLDQAPTVDVTLWYIPTPTTLAAAGTFDSIDGWDAYLILWVKLKVRAKQEYDLGDVASELADVRRRVKNAAARITSYSDTVEDWRNTADDWFYNG